MTVLSHSVASDSLWPMDCSSPGSSVHGIFRARVLEWVAISFSRRSSQPRNQTQVSRTADRRFTISATREECWNGLPFPFPGDLPDPEFEPVSPTLQAEALFSEPCKSDNLVPVVQNLGKISQIVTKLNSANNK